MAQIGGGNAAVAAPGPWAASSPLDDRTVVERVLAGETALFEILMRRYNQRLFRTAYAVLRDAHEAEDTMQEAYVRAYEHLGDYRGEARVATWLTRIALHEALARVRKRDRRRRLDEAAPDRAAVSALPGPESSSANLELRSFLRQAIDRLPPDRRVVFMVRDVEGLSTREAAECLGISEQSVKTRLHRARAQLRRVLDAQLGPECRQLYTFGFSRCHAIVAAVLVRIRRRRRRP